MKTIPRLTCLALLLSASGLVSRLDQKILHRLGSVAFIPDGAVRSGNWHSVTLAPIGPATTAGRAGALTTLRF